MPFREAPAPQLTQLDENSSDTVSSQLAFPLAGFPKGQYVLQANTIDTTSQESLIERIAFAVR